MNLDHLISSFPIYKMIALLPASKFCCEDPININNPQNSMSPEILDITLVSQQTGEFIFYLATTMVVISYYSLNSLVHCIIVI